MSAKVVIGCPMHGKEDLLELYFNHLAAIDYDNKYYAFVINNPSKRLMDLLGDFLLINSDKTISILDNTKKSYTDRSSARYKSLVHFRNTLLDVAFYKMKADFLLSIDCDMFVEPSILKELLSYKKDIIGGLAYVDEHWNHNKPHSQRYCNVMKRENGGRYRHYKNPPLNELFETDLVGGVYLLSKRVYNSGVRYIYHTQGEDCGFYNIAHEEGFKVYCTGKLIEHRM